MVLIAKDNKLQFDLQVIESIRRKDNRTAQYLCRDVVLNNLVDSSGRTLLHVAAKIGSHAMTQWLIDYGLDVNAQRKDGRTPLMVAVQYERSKNVKVLLKANAKIDIVDNNGRNVLEYAEIMETKMSTSLIMKFIADCETEEEAAVKLFNAKCPLPLLVLTENSKIIKYFLERGVDVDVREHLIGRTALQMAVYYQDLKSVELLLEYGADVNSKDESGYAPLHYVGESYYCKDEQPEILKVLLDRGADMNLLIEPMGYSQISSVFHFCSVESIRLVLQRNIDLRAKDGSGSTPLHYLAGNTDPDILELLQDRTLDVNERNNDGSTALHTAALCGPISTLQFLLDRSADVNARDKDGMTPLCKVVMRLLQPDQVRSKYFELLLRYGADAQIVTCEGLTIFDMILDYKRFCLEEPFLAHLAILESTGSQVKNEISKKIYTSVRFQIIFNIYKQQLEQFKKSVVFESVTMFKLLTENEQKLLVYLRNQQIVLKLVRMNYKNDQREYYYRKLRERITRLIQKVQLRVRAGVALCKIMQFGYNSHPTITDEICSYLSESDLLQLAQISNVYV